MKDCHLDIYPEVQFSSVQSFSHFQLCNPMDCSMPGFPIHHQLPELTQTQVHQVSDAIQLSHPLSSLSPFALNISQHRVFSNESALRIRWSKYWSFSISLLPCIKQRASGKLLNSTGSSALCPVMTKKGGMWGPRWRRHMYTYKLMIHFVVQQGLTRVVKQSDSNLKKEQAFQS